MAGDRWPPVYDAEDLVREIKRLTDRPDIANAFYEWRLDSSTRPVDDVCQGDIVRLASDVPVILADGQPGVIDHPDGAWLVLGNTCDFDREIGDVRWTQMVPLRDLGEMSEVSDTERAALRRYTQSRVFYVPPWSAQVTKRVHAADLLRPVAVDKRVFISAPTTATVEARMARAAWVLLNACLVRFLARDDGRYA